MIRSPAVPASRWPTQAMAFAECACNWALGPTPW